VRTVGLDSFAVAAAHTKSKLGTCGIDF